MKYQLLNVTFKFSSFQNNAEEMNNGVLHPNDDQDNQRVLKICLTEKSLNQMYGEFNKRHKVSPTPVSPVMQTKKK